MHKNCYQKVPHSIIIKAFSKLGLKENFFNLINDIYKNKIISVLNGERLNAIPLRSEDKEAHSCHSVQYWKF
jgi:hypothetical protein